MIPKDCRRLAEVDFPIAEVSRHAAREKSIRHGHPSTLHFWRARRPLAACRAVLLGLLLPDPCDPRCPQAFKDGAREALLGLPGHPRGWERTLQDDAGLREALFRFIADFANWDLAADPSYLATARALVCAAFPDEPPLVVDPFAGGGSIPLEALRLGCEAFASDLNPVAGLILKVLLEEIPRYGRSRLTVPTADGGVEEVEGLAEAVRRVGALVKARAERELAEFYPPDPDGARPIAYLWARTVRCEAPGCGAEIPLARSFWLAKKAHRRRALRYRVERPAGGPPQVVFEVFEPNTEGEVPRGTVSRGNATCLACGTVLRVERVRAQLVARRGGADVVFDQRGRRTGGARLLAVVTARPGEQGRHYRLPTDADYAAVWRAARALAERATEPLPDGRPPVPDEPFPQNDTRAFTPSVYGMRTWGDLFTARQKLALTTLARAVRELPATVPEAVRLAMALVVDRCADRLSTACRLDTSRDTITDTMSRQALPMVWDFCEANPFSDLTGGYGGALEWVAKVIEAWPGSSSGQAQVADAAAHPLPDDAATVWFTDPPYYDAVPYADLSDFFFVWLTRSLPGHSLLRDPFTPANPLTPKTAEIVQNAAVRLSGVVKDRAFFEEGMARAFREGRRVLRDDGIGAVVFAHKSTEGWEALLSGLVRAGWTVTASWPITTEMGARLRARESAALAASVHLVLRPRPEDAPVGDWGEVLRELPRRVGEWMGRLQGEGIRGADLVFACIGPALEIFSRYARVETAEGRQVTLNEYLEKIWEVVGRAALQQVLGAADGGAGALEEDARLTALFLWTLQSTNGLRANGQTASPVEAAADEEEELAEGGDDEDEDEGGKGSGARAAGGFSLVYDVVRRFAQPLGIHLPRWEGRVIEIKKGVVRLLTLRERARVLFGPEGMELVAERIERAPRGPVQLALALPDADAPSRPSPRRGRHGATVAGGTGGAPADEALTAPRGATTLDRVHTAMLLQAAGRAAALRALLTAEVERGPDFLRLANALSALYPGGSEEKRLVDAMLLAVPK
jgi:putative DNA methylase